MLEVRVGGSEREEDKDEEEEDVDEERGLEERFFTGREMAGWRELRSSESNEPKCMRRKSQVEDHQTKERVRSRG